MGAVPPVYEANAAAERNQSYLLGSGFPGGRLLDATQPGEGGGAGRHGGADLGGGRADRPIQVTDLGDEIGGYPAHGAQTDGAPDLGHWRQLR